MRIEKSFHVKTTVGLQREGHVTTWWLYVLDAAVLGEMEIDGVVSSLRSCDGQAVVALIVATI